MEHSPILYTLLYRSEDYTAMNILAALLIATRQRRPTDHSGPSAIQLDVPPFVYRANPTTTLQRRRTCLSLTLLFSLRKGFKTYIKVKKQNNVFKIRVQQMLGRFGTLGKETKGLIVDNYSTRASGISIKLYIISKINIYIYNSNIYYNKYMKINSNINLHFI